MVHSSNCLMCGMYASRLVLWTAISKGVRTHVNVLYSVLYITEYLCPNAKKTVIKWIFQDTYYIEAINITVITQTGDIPMANKIDIYQYSSATDVRTLTLSNCASTSADDYMVIVQSTSDDNPAGMLVMKPASISGSTMTLHASEDLEKCTMICVIQQGD